MFKRYKEKRRAELAQMVEAEIKKRGLAKDTDLKVMEIEVAKSNELIKRFANDISKVVSDAVGDFEALLEEHKEEVKEANKTLASNLKKSTRTTFNSMMKKEKGQLELQVQNELSKIVTKQKGSGGGTSGKDLTDALNKFNADASKALEKVSAKLKELLPELNKILDEHSKEINDLSDRLKRAQSYKRNVTTKGGFEETIRKLKDN